jgi:hypothetical protein
MLARRHHSLRNPSAAILCVLFVVLGLSKALRGADTEPDLLLEYGANSCIARNQGSRIIGASYFGQQILTDICFPGGRAFGDINGDGRLDMVDELGVFLGHGDGKFGVLTTAFVNQQTGMAFACADLNKDGLDDVVIGTRGIRVFFGKKDGTLEPVGGVLDLPYEVGIGATTLRLIDLDNDGHEDLLGTSDVGAVSAFGKGFGAFGENTQKLGYLQNSTIIDLDGDGLLDVVAEGPYRNSPGERDKPMILVSYTQGNGKISDPTFIPVQSLAEDEVFPLGVTVGDANQDGVLDLVAAGRLGHLSVFLGKPGGMRFEDEIEVALPFTDWATGLLLHDLDADGVDDLVVNYSDNERHWIQVYWGKADELLDFGTSTEIRYLAHRISIAPSIRKRFIRGDANQDGKVDLADALTILGELFQGRPMICGDASDVNDSSLLDLTDAVYLLHHLFQGGSPPAHPYPSPGGDPTFESNSLGGLDDLGCSFETYHSDDYEPCLPDNDQSKCKNPIKQYLDLWRE